MGESGFQGIGTVYFKKVITHQTTLRSLTYCCYTDAVVCRRHPNNSRPRSLARSLYLRSSACRVGKVHWGLSLRSVPSSNSFSITSWNSLKKTSMSFA